MSERRTIGILLPNLNAGYDMAVLGGAQQVADEQGARVVAVWGAPGDVHATHAAGAAVDGWVVVLNIPRPERIVGTPQAAGPLVVVGANMPDLSAPAVLPDNYGGTLAAVRHLLDHGHRRIGFAGDPRFDDLRERYAGYQAALAERGLAPDPRTVFFDARYYGFDGGQLAARQIVDSGFPCSAVVAANDLYALSLLDGIRAAGRRVPEDVAVVGFDDIPEASAAIPPLTTVRQPYAELGRAAAELLLAQLRGERVDARVHTVATTLAVRRSCGCPWPVSLSEGAPQASLAEGLAALAAGGFSPSPAALRAARRMAGILEVCRAGAEPGAAALEECWRELAAVSDDPQVLDAQLALVERAAADLLAGAGPEGEARLRQVGPAARTALLRVLTAAQRAAAESRERLLRANHLIALELLGSGQADSDRLAWLRHTDIPWAVLARWCEPGEGGAAQLEVAGVYAKRQPPALAVGWRAAAAEFLPLDRLPHPEDGHVIMLLPVRAALHDWGLLVVCRPLGGRGVQWADDDVRMWASMLGAALEHAALDEQQPERHSLRGSHEQQLVAENIRDLVFSVNISGYFLYASPSFQRVLGHQPAWLHSLSVFDLIHPDDVTVVQQAWSFTGSDPEPQVTFRFRHADESWRWLEVSGLGVSHDGRPALVLVGQDVTERKRLEAEVLQAQKMESIGRLAGGVAHDFNNLITAISGYTSLLLDTLGASSEAAGDLVEIQKAARRAADLTSQLLAFARRQRIEPRALQLNDLIRDIERLLRRLIGEHVELVTTLAPDLDLVEVDPGQIEQLLINMAVNARDAMPAGGRLTITTSRIADGADGARAAGPDRAGYVRLTISDTGVGIDAEAQAHIFEPFFTTKGPDRGSGLGLATCYGIVRQHGGHITLESEAGRGTTFRILLPRAKGRALVPELAQQRYTPAPQRRAETVLLVEDDPAVHSLAVRVLQAEGYTVLAARDGVEALEVAEGHAEPIDLVLTDVVMPRMGGIAVASAFRQRDPAVKVMLMSGYLDDVPGAQEAGLPLLQKPFTPASLAVMVRRLLESPGR